LAPAGAAELPRRELERFQEQLAHAANSCSTTLLSDVLGLPFDLRLALIDDAMARAMGLHRTCPNKPAALADGPLLDPPFRPTSHWLHAERAMRFTAASIDGAVSVTVWPSGRCVGRAIPRHGIDHSTQGLTLLEAWMHACWAALSLHSTAPSAHHQELTMPKPDAPTVDWIARTAHEVNRAYCAALGDDSQLPWDEAPEWQRTSVIRGVVFHVQHPQAGPEDSHESWMREKRSAGWAYGEVKDADAKTHPCLVPFEQLAPSQQAKDYIFRAIVHQLTDSLPTTGGDSQ